MSVYGVSKADYDTIRAENDALKKDNGPLRAFFSKHALGGLAAPSCLLCGQIAQMPAITHAELPQIAICTACRDAQTELAACRAERDALKKELNESKAQYSRHAIRVTQEQLAACRAELATARNELQELTCGDTPYTALAAELVEAKASRDSQQRIAIKSLLKVISLESELAEAKTKNQQLRAALKRLKTACIESGDLYYASIASDALNPSDASTCKSPK